MPQMKPLNWLYLYLLFSMILMFKITFNFFNINHNMNYKNIKLTPMNNKWKW